MRYQIIGKNITVTEGISNKITKTLSKLDKYFNKNDDVLARVVVRVYNGSDEAKVEVTIFSKDTTFRAEVKNHDLYAAVDLAVDKLLGQMRKFKTQLKKRYEHEGLGKAIVFEALKDEEVKEQEAAPVKTKLIDLKPISVEEALVEMELIGHDFYLYLDTDDEKISVLYKRKEGGYGLLQADKKIEIK